MSSTIVNCGICGLGVRFPGDQPVPEVVVCESYICNAEVARQDRVNRPLETVASPGKSGDAPQGKGKGKGPK